MTEKKSKPQYTAEFRERGIGLVREQRADFGVGPICTVLPIASSTAYRRLAIKRDPNLASGRTKQDALDTAQISHVYEASGQRYGSRKVWHQLCQEGYEIGKSCVERLMKSMKIQGVVRGKKVITTNLDTSQPCPLDKVNRKFCAPCPNHLWISDFTYVSTWQGMVYVAFVIDVFSRRIVGLLSANVPFACRAKGRSQRP